MKSRDLILQTLATLAIVLIFAPGPILADEDDTSLALGFVPPSPEGDTGRLRVECYKVGQMPESVTAKLSSLSTREQSPWDQHADIYALIFRVPEHEKLVRADAWIDHGQAIGARSQAQTSFWLKSLLVIGGCWGAKSLLKDTDAPIAALIAPFIFDVVRDFIVSGGGETTIAMESECAFKEDEITDLAGASFLTVGMTHTMGTTIEFHEIITEIVAGAGAGKRKVYYCSPVIVPGEEASYMTYAQLAHVIHLGSTGDVDEELVE